MTSRTDFLSNGLRPAQNADSICPICSQEEPRDLVALPCHESHLYHSDCIRTWLQRPGVNTCPSCRTVLFDLPEGETRDEDEDHEDGEEIGVNDSYTSGVDSDYTDNEEEDDEGAEGLERLPGGTMGAMLGSLVVDGDFELGLLSWRLGGDPFIDVFPEPEVHGPLDDEEPDSDSLEDDLAQEENQGRMQEEEEQTTVDLRGEEFPINWMLPSE